MHMRLLDSKQKIRRSNIDGQYDRVKVLFKIQVSDGQNAPTRGHFHQC